MIGPVHVLLGCGCACVSHSQSREARSASLWARDCMFVCFPLVPVRPPLPVDAEYATPANGCAVMLQHQHQHQHQHSTDTAQAYTCSYIQAHVQTNTRASLSCAPHACIRSPLHRRPRQSAPHCCCVRGPEHGHSGPYVCPCTHVWCVFMSGVGVQRDHQLSCASLPSQARRQLRRQGDSWRPRQAGRQAGSCGGRQAGWLAGWHGGVASTGSGALHAQRPRHSALGSPFANQPYMQRVPRSRESLGLSMLQC